MVLFRLPIPRSKYREVVLMVLLGLRSQVASALRLVPRVLAYRRDLTPDNLEHLGMEPISFVVLDAQRAAESPY
jgi:hypothetical protein